jgi:hypothetical protein
MIGFSGGSGISKTNNGAKRGILGNPINDANYLIGEDDGTEDNPGDDNTGNNPGSNPGSGSSGGSGTNAPAASSTTPITTANGSVSIDYTNSNGDIRLSLPTAKLAEIINNSNNDTAVIDASGVSGATTLTIDKEPLSRIANAVPNVTLHFPCGNITFDSAAARSILTAANASSVSFGFAPVSAQSLPSAWRMYLGADDSVFDISLSSGTQNITAFNGFMTISVPYAGTLPAAAWYLGETGKEKFESNYDASTNMLSFSLPGHFSYYAVGPDDEAAWENPFADVSESDWFYGDIEYAVTSGLFTGSSANAFDPNGTMTRAMLVTVLGRFAGANADSETDSVGGFVDVPAGQYYTPYAVWAKEEGITDGTGNNKFSPDAAITRQDLATLLLRYANTTGKQFPVTLQYAPFADENQISDYARTAAETLYCGNIITGKPNNLFDPRGNATRAEVAAVMRRFAEAALQIE